MDKSRLIYFDGMKSITFDEYPDEAWKYFTNGPHSEDKTVQTLYQTLAIVFRGVSLRSQAVASMPFAIYNSKGGEVDSSSDYKNILGFWPNPRKTLGLIESSLTLLGSAYLFKVRSKRRILDLRYIVPTTIIHTATEADGLTGFTRSLSTGQKQLAIDDIVYFWYPDPMVELGPPTTSPAKAALNAGGVLVNIDEFVANFWKRGAIKAMMLLVKNMPNPSERSRLETIFKDIVTGVKNAFAAHVFNADALTPVIIGEGLEGLANQTLTTEKREDIALALGIAYTKLFSGSASGLGGGGVTAQDDKRFLTDTIIPECEQIEDVINDQLLVPLNYRLAFLPETLDALQEDEVQRSGAYAAYVSTGMKPSIAARIIGLELPEGVEYEDLDPEEEPEPPAPVIEPIPPTPEPEAASVAELPSTEDDEQKSWPTYRLAIQDMKAWKRKAVAAVKAGESATVTFTSDYLDPAFMAETQTRLAGCKTVEDVKAAFSWLRLPSEGYTLTAEQIADANVYPPADVRKDTAMMLEGLKLAVEFAMKALPEHNT